MKSFNLCLLGFGNVNRTLVELLRLKDADLRERHGIGWRITGVASRRIGWLAHPEGFDSESLCGADTLVREKLASAQKLADLHSWLDAARPDVVWFGESLDEDLISLAVDAAQSADVFFSVGTSSVIQPAASLSMMAKDSGALVVEVNPHETAFTEYADHSARTGASQFFPALVEALSRQNI